MVVRSFIGVRFGRTLNPKDHNRLGGSGAALRSTLRSKWTDHGLAFAGVTERRMEAAYCHHLTQELSLDTTSSS
jgi:hypothetical protein